MSTFNEQLDSNIIKQIEELYKKIDKNSEFEFMFFNYKKDINRMGLDNFLKILEYLNFKAKKNNRKNENIVQLDINYSKQSETYRITIDGLESINKYIKMLHMRKNHVIFSVLVGLAEKDKNIKLMKKIKDRENIIDINDFDVRVRLSEENEMDKKEISELKKLNEKERSNIIFRYKQRISYNIVSNENFKMTIDLTNIKMSNIMNRLEENISSYELEIDLSSNVKLNDKKYLSMIYDEITILLKVIQQSNFIVTRNLENEIIQTYAKLLNVDESKMTSLEGRRPQSLEVQHVVDQLPNKYAVTDKADGERHFLIIYKNMVYLISDLLNVKNTGIMIPESKSKYNNSILDGELILIKSQNRYLFMAFDCLHNGSTDVRQLASLFERLNNADEIINECFILKNQKGYKFDDLPKGFKLNEILNFHNKSIEEYMKSINNDMKYEKVYPLIRRKYFIGALGGQDNEIFKYSELIWNKYVFDKSINCPYILDGLIYHPLDQKYVTSVKESKFIEYKWKPVDKNSIDFYILFERNKENNKIVTLYDNSKEEDDQIRGKPYKIAKLYVGKFQKNLEQPILFEPEIDSVKYLAYLFLENGEVRDLENNIIQDATVVEFYYNNDPNIPDKHRWVPIRTRYDKTESVQRYGKKYGNYVDIAYKVWRSIRNPFTMDDINILAKNDMYNKHIEILRGKIDHSVILSEKKENIYYQIRTTLGKPMRNFHNWIKSILIYTYVNPMYELNRKQLTVLDIACGRGGDLMKFYYGQVQLYVGIDIDNNGLISPVDGAISRYNQLKKTHPNFPKMVFIHADGGALLDYSEQVRALGNMTNINRDLMNQYFSNDDSKRFKFDRINCQFAFHYFLANQTVWDNYVANINNYLKPGGFMIMTTFDADRIVELLDGKTQYTSYYTNSNGEQKVLFELVKKYDDNIKIGDSINIGAAIDFHNALDFQEGVYKTEYLVQKKFIENDFIKKCDLEIVETDLFENQYIINSDYFLKTIQYEDNEKTRKFLKDVMEYYTQKSEVNSASYQLTRLYRHYVFRKKDDKIKRKMKGGIPKGNKTKITMNDQIFNDAPDLFNPMQFIKRNINDKELDNYSFLASVHDILKVDKIIPETVSVMEFYNDLSYDICEDDEINSSKIDELSKKLLIKHDYNTNSESEVALNGINLLVIKKNNNKTYVEDYGNKKNDLTTILYYDGNKYYPVYKVKNKQLIGTFDSKSTFIKKIR